MTIYGRSPWLERVPRSRVPSYPRLKESFATDVVIVGGGLTGCATAYAMAAAGVKVALVEAEAIGRASSAMAFGWLADHPTGGFQDLVQAHGLRDARRAWQAWRRAAMDGAATFRRLGIKCGLEPRQHVLVARTREQAAWLAREAKARREAGLPSVALTARAASAEAATPAVAGLRSRDGATLDPYRAALGLAAAAAARGSRLFERTPARKIRPGAKAVEVSTDGGVLTAARVVVATGQPTGLFRSLARHVRAQTSYLALTEPIPARTRNAIGAASTSQLVVVDSAVPPHYVRWVDGECLLVAGADAGATPARGRDKVLVQRTGQLMYELSTVYPDISGVAPTHGWSVDYGATVDGLPFIGPHRNFPRHLFAFGGSGHSLTEAGLASRVLLRHHVGTADPGDEVFGFTRG